MPVQLTEEQRLAVTLEDNIAVTAGAGTGKTSAMTERVVRVLDGLERIDQLLVVTFTEDAAGEIRRRVYQALLTRIRGSAGADRARMEAMRDRFLQNHISTMHAFFARLLRRFPDRLAGVDPDFRVISGAEQQDLLRVSVEAVIDGVASAGDGPLSDDLRTWLRQHRRAGVCACVSAVIRKRIEVAEWLRHMTEGDSGEDYVTQERAARDFLARARGAFFGDERVRAMVEALRAAAPVSAAAEDALTRRRETVLNAVADEDVAALCVELLTKAGAPRTRRLGSKGAWDEDAGDAARGALFAIADMLVLPSAYQETWGLIINEAMNFGCPVIVSDRVSCGCDLVADTCGLIFPYDDRPALVAALRKLAGDDAMRAGFRAGAKARIAGWNVSGYIAGQRRALRLSD